LPTPGKKHTHDKFQQHRNFLAPDPNRKLGENIKQNLGQNVGIHKGRDLGWGNPTNVEIPQNRRFQLPCLPPTTGEDQHLNPAPPRIKPREKHPCRWDDLIDSGGVRGSSGGWRLIVNNTDPNRHETTSCFFLWGELK
jgi:hypothetical protein